MRAILRTSKSKEGQDLFTHLTDIMNHISMHCPDQAMDKLEEISYLIKNKETIDMAQFLKIAEDRKYSQADEKLAAHTKEVIVKARKFFEVSIIDMPDLIIYSFVESCQARRWWRW